MGGRHQSAQPRPRGWAQQADFVVFGVFTLVCTAAGWHLALAPGFGSIAYPVLRGIEGVSLIVLGFLSQDPALGYPPGSIVRSATVPGKIHAIFSFVSITAVALGSFVLARRMAAERHWGPGWAGYCVLTGILTIVFIAMFGSLSAKGGVAGLFERASIGVNSVFSVLVVGRLLIQARPGAP